MKSRNFILLLLAGVGFAWRPVRAGNDLVVHSGGRLIIHTNVQVDAGTFKVESGGTLDIDLGSKLTATNIVYAGTLTVSSNNFALAAGQNYQLFSAPSYSGAFISINLPTLATNFTWANTLVSDGTISVINTPSTNSMKFTELTFSGGQLHFNGSGGSPNGQYVILTSTNIAKPVASWGVLSTNQCDANGNFSFMQPMIPGHPYQFFLLQIK